MVLPGHLVGRDHGPDRLTGVTGCASRETITGMNATLILVLALVLAIAGIVVLAKIVWLGGVLLVLGVAAFLLAQNLHRRDVER